MERLTEWHDDGMLKGVLVKEEYGEQGLKTLFEETDEGYRGMCTLKSYEDTGLTPREIMDLKERDAAKAPAEADEDFGYFKCPSCGTNIIADDFNDHKFCLNCGQRLKF